TQRDRNRQIFYCAAALRPAGADAGIVCFLYVGCFPGENQDSIYLFLDIIGGMLGPVIGVMLDHYFVASLGFIQMIRRDYCQRGE
ncbi:hypothetical protein NH824_23675, partial [Salmonella enterica]|uniref:hypothetical protein n=1 Tax=Salmonella enterica TaxID=28901 RepID=UPI0022B60479